MPTMKPIVLFFQSTWSKSWKDKLTGVYDYADKVGWQIQVIEAGSSRREVLEALRKWNPVGCLVDRGMQNSEPPQRLFGNLPVVFLDQNPRNAGDCTFITHDSGASVSLALEEFRRIGLPRLAYCGWKTAIFWNEQRRSAFEAFARKWRIEHHFLPSSGIDTALARLPRPCGIVCANDITAQNVMAEISRLDFHVPEDFAVIGIDNDEFICEHTSPSLTSVDPGFVEAGYRLAELLHRRMSTPSAPHIHASYGPKALILRDSHRWLPNLDGRVKEAMEYIRRNIADPSLTVNDVVSVMGCSRSLADLLFRKASGSSIIAEIQRVRVDLACRLLANPRQRISAVPSLCGYRSEPFFKRLFKRSTGCTMREWRKSRA